MGSWKPNPIIKPMTREELEQHMETMRTLYAKTFLPQRGQPVKLNGVALNKKSK